MASLALIICIKHKKINPDNIVVGIVPEGWLLLGAAGLLGLALARVAELVLAVFGAVFLKGLDCPLVHDMFLSSHGFPDPRDASKHLSLLL